MIHTKIRSFGYAIIFIIIIAASVLVLSEKINLTNSDTGRHIINGKVLLTGTADERHDVLYTNFYSYTQKDFPFINHHWGTGLLFYKIWKYFGFEGLSVIYIFFLILTILLSLYLALRKGGPRAAAISAAIMFVLLVMRREVRPEVFTYFFAVLFFIIAWLYKRREISKGWLWGLIFLQVIWVNLHIGFFIGEVIIAIFLISDIIGNKADRSNSKTFAYLLAGLFAATILNPSLVKGALYPLFIFSNYGYGIIENMSVFKYDRSIGFTIEHQVFKAVIVLLWMLFALYVYKSKRKELLRDPLVLVNLFTSFLALQAVRNIILFALFAVPLFAEMVMHLFSSPSARWYLRAVLFLSMTGVITFAYSVWDHRGIYSGIGLFPGVENVMKFYNTAKFQGPIFNNYNNGGYLIYELYGRERLFVDNRPEAYPSAFFKDVYIPAQWNQESWKVFDERYKFNAIWFHRIDSTNESRIFLKNRIKDRAWALVYEDRYNIIFLKRTPQNHAIISKYEMIVR